MSVQDINKKLVFATVLALTLGLAPFFPEPHLFGKIRWLAGGAKGMGAIDYFDVLLHGFPWVYLIYVVSLRIRLLIKD